MSKYTPLWEYISKKGGRDSSRDGILIMTYEDIKCILGFAIDHSFLTYKKEIIDYGWSIGKISMKNQTVQFIRKVG